MIDESALPGLKDSLRSHASVADRIAVVIRDGILAGKLNPGERVIESRIARGLGVGQPTVREALTLLEYQGLIFRKMNQGCYVAELSPEEIELAKEIRWHLESCALRLAARHGSASTCSRLKACCEKITSAASTNDLESYFAHVLTFHQELWRLSGNRFLERVIQQLALPVTAFALLPAARRASSSEFAAQSAQYPYIVEALEAGDGESAIRAAALIFQSPDAHAANV